MNEKDYELFLAKTSRELDEEEQINLSTAYEHSKLIKSNYYSKFHDLDEIKQREKYNKYIKIIIAKQIAKYDITSFEKINEAEITKYFMNILNIIFGDINKISKEIDIFLENMVINEDTLDPMNGYSLHAVNTITGEEGYNIIIPSMNNLSVISCLSHEFLHFHFQYNKTECKMFQYGEILSIFAEKLAAEMISKNNDESMIKKIESIRLDTIKWHYKDKVDETNKYKGQIKYLNDIYTKRMIEESLLYENDLSLSYGLGYLYAEHLFQLFIDNPSSVSIQLQKVLYGEESLENLLGYYNISTNNKETFEIAKKKIRKI